LRRETLYLLDLPLYTPNFVPMSFRLEDRVELNSEMSNDKELAAIMQRKMKEMASKARETNSEVSPTIDAPVTLTDSDFNTFVSSNRFVVVDFWADWCAPCRMISPIIEELAREFRGRIYFGKLNVDLNPNIPSRYRVTGIPTLLVFKDGRLAERIVGFQQKSSIRSTLNKLILT
jgi:thioredoxin 1